MSTWSESGSTLGTHLHTSALLWKAHHSPSSTDEKAKLRKPGLPCKPYSLHVDPFTTSRWLLRGKQWPRGPHSRTVVWKGYTEMSPHLGSQRSLGDVSSPVLWDRFPKLWTISRVSSPSFNILDVPKDSCPYTKGPDIRKAPPVPSASRGFEADFPATSEQLFLVRHGGMSQSLTSVSNHRNSPSHQHHLTKVAFG